MIYKLLGLVSLTSASPLWPLPLKSTLGSTPFSIENDFVFKQTSTYSEFLNQATERYQTLINPTNTYSPNTISSCSIFVNQINENELDTLVVGADESYQLSISSTGDCSITAETVWGAIHGLESFTQLLERDSSGSVLMNYSPVSIEDEPRFSHRGLLIDSSRHYLPVSAIQRIIDSLPMNKFNALHWHMVDAQSFPADTPSAPYLVQGAYDPSMVYSMQEVAGLTQYAADRGVRLLVEVDVPGHAASWLKGYPQIMATCIQKYTNVNNYALNPVLEETYEVVGAVLKDIIQTTGAKLFHVGGDEVVYGCWKEDASITQYMAQHGITSYDDILEMFVLRVDDIVRSLGATPVHWEEVFTAGAAVHADTVFEVWTAQSMMSAIANANFTIISAPSDVWYLDHADNTWDVMYQYDPTSSLTAQQESLVLGGEVCMWGEHVDENNIESIVYPRASSVAERLWSSRELNSSSEAHDRFGVQRCRMIQRGLRVSAIEPGYCSKTLV